MHIELCLENVSGHMGDIVIDRKIMIVILRM
jgi:hypothetical protein